MISNKSAPTDTTNKYRRDMGTLGIAFLVVNGLIGAGIFGLPEVLHQSVGTFAPWLLLISGLLVMSIGVCFAELTKTTDRSGGPQRFVADAWGSYPGFMVGWSFYAARVIGFGANVLVLIAYAAALWPAVGDGIVKIVAIIVIFGGLALINVVGVRRAVGTLGALTLLKLLPLILLMVVGIGAASAPGPIVLPQFSAIEGIALALLYAFVGFENATVPAGETRNPRRAMPRALLLSLPLVSLIYFGLQWAYSHSAIAGSNPEAPITALARLYWGDIGATLIAATIVVSVLANLMAAYTSSSRMPSAFADDKLIPAWFGRVSRWGTPANAILFQFVLITLFALVDDFLVLAVMSSVARLIAYVASILSLPKLRRQSEHKAINLKIAFAAPIALTLCIWAMTQTHSGQWLTLGSFAVVGTVLFFVARRGVVMSTSQATKE